MKKTKHCFVALVCVIVMLSVSSNSYAYDFSSVASTGQTLYYNITSDSTVAVVSPCSTPSNNNWAGYTPPTGSLSIPSTVEYLGVTYSVTAIEGGAFWGCSSLTSVTIPSSIVEIGGWAFCSSALNTINYPSSAILLGGWVFEDTPWLNNKPNGVVYLENTLYCYKGTAPANYSLTIPSNVNSIAGRAFCRNGYEAGQTNLVSVQIPNSVKYIGASAFYKCHLNTISLPEGLEVIGQNAFAYNYFPEVTIPSSVKYLGSSAFDYCGSLATVNYNAVAAQGEGGSSYNYVFYHCTNLTTINLGVGVQTIPAGIFYGCSNVVEELVFPNTINTIGNHAFYGCSGLTGTLVIPTSTLEIGECAFYGCSGLTALNVNAINVGNSAFSNCSNITQLTIGENVDSVGFGAFSNLTNLTTLFYNAINMHTNYAGGLNGCSTVSSIEFGEGVLQIPDGFMSQSLSLTSVSLPTSLISIGQSAFFNCAIAGELTLPENLQSIGSYSFYYCQNVTSVRCLCVIPPSINADVLYSCHDKPLIVPCSSVENYQSAAGWNLFQDISGSGDCNYYVDIIVNDPSMGSVSGGGNYNAGATATLTATANSGFHFVRWSDNNTQNPRNITVNSNITLTAYFASNAGIDGIDDSDIIACVTGHHIVVENAVGKNICAFSIDGRMIATKCNAAEQESIPVPTTGVYFIKVDGYPARKVVVVR